MPADNIGKLHDAKLYAMVLKDVVGLKAEVASNGFNVSVDTASYRAAEKTAELLNSLVGRQVATTDEITVKIRPEEGVMEKMTSNKKSFQEATRLSDFSKDAFQKNTHSR